MLAAISAKAAASPCHGVRQDRLLNARGRFHFLAQGLVARDLARHDLDRLGIGREVRLRTQHPADRIDGGRALAQGTRGRDQAGEMPSGVMQSGGNGLQDRQRDLRMMRGERLQVGLVNREHGHGLARDDAGRARAVAEGTRLADDVEGSRLADPDPTQALELDHDVDDPGDQ